MEDSIATFDVLPEVLRFMRMTSRSCWTAAFAEDSTSLKPWREVQIPLQSDAHTYLDSLLVVLMGSMKLSNQSRMYLANGFVGVSNCI